MRGSAVKSRGLGLALVSAVAFGGSGVAAKPLIDLGLDPLQVVWMRVAGAALVLLPVALRSRVLPRRRPGLVAGFGLLAIVGCQALYFVAIARIPVGIAILVEYLGPALLLGWIRFVQRRPVTRAAAVGVVLATAGMACVVEVWSGLAFDALGLLYAFGAACCQVAYFVLAEGGRDGAEAPEPVSVIAHGLVVGALALTVVSHPWTMRWHTLGQQAALGDREVPAVLLVCWIALVSTVVAYLTGVMAVRTLSPQVAAVVGGTEAVIATVLAWILLAEHLGLAQITGGVLVVAGALVAQTASAARSASAEGAVVAGGPTRKADASV